MAGSSGQGLGIARRKKNPAKLRGRLLLALFSTFLLWYTINREGNCMGIKDIGLGVTQPGSKSWLCY